MTPTKALHSQARVQADTSCGYGRRPVLKLAGVLLTATLSSYYRGEIHSTSQTEKAETRKVGTVVNSGSFRTQRRSWRLTALVSQKRCASTTDFDNVFAYLPLGKILC